MAKASLSAAAVTYSLPVGSVMARGILPTAVPFMLCASGYFYALLAIRDQLSLETMSVLKCAPIIALALLVAIRRGRSSPYKLLVVSGLLISAVGDYYLVWKGDDNFLKGMAAFGLAHLFYIVAFGFRPLVFRAAIPVVALAAGALHFLLPNLNGILATAVPVYVGVISVMLWRSLAACASRPCSIAAAAAAAAASITSTTSTTTGAAADWSHVAGALGAVLFAMSDLNLSVNAFCVAGSNDIDNDSNNNNTGNETMGASVGALAEASGALATLMAEHADLITMLTYYGGQLGLALSVVDRQHMAECHMAKHQPTLVTDHHSNDQDDCEDETDDDCDKLVLTNSAR